MTPLNQIYVPNDLVIPKGIVQLRPLPMRSYTFVVVTIRNTWCASGESFGIYDTTIVAMPSYDHIIIYIYIYMI